MGVCCCLIHWLTVARQSGGMVKGANSRKMSPIVAMEQHKVKPAGIPSGAVKGHRTMPTTTLDLWTAYSIVKCTVKIYDTL